MAIDIQDTWLKDCTIFYLQKVNESPSNWKSLAGIQCLSGKKGSMNFLVLIGDFVINKQFRKLMIITCLGYDSNIKS